MVSGTVSELVKSIIGLNSSDFSNFSDLSLNFYTISDPLRKTYITYALLSRKNRDFVNMIIEFRKKIEQPISPTEKQIVPVQFAETLKQNTNIQFPIWLGKETIKLEQENAKAMIDGFVKNGQNFKVTIFTAHARAWSMKAGNFRDVPKLITPKKAKPLPWYPLSPIGRDLNTNGYLFDHPGNYIAVLDTIFHIENHASIWQTLCKNDIFDLWNWEAPFNSLNGKEDPMILILRIFQIDHSFINEIKEGPNKRYCIIPERKVNIMNKVIPNDRFNQIKKTLYDILDSRLLTEESCKDTNKLG